jgi:hypothetical protein
MDKTAADLDVTDKQLFDLVSRSVEDGVNAVRELEKRGKYIPTYTHFPELAYSRRGFPQITNKLFSKVKQYSLALPLGPTNSSDISLSEFPSFVDLVVYANSNQLIRDYYLRGLDLKGYTQEQEHKRIKLGISFFLTDLLERYLYVVEEAGSFSKDKLLPIYLELERGIFSEKLPVEAVVPIALTKFEVDYFEINDRTALERMDDGFQKARFLNEYEAVGIHESVLGASTHALVLKEWELPYNPCFFEDFGEIGTTPVNRGVERKGFIRDT